MKGTKSLWHEQKSENNVIALIDIAFLLIIFLMVVTEFASVDRIEKLTLPTAVEAKPETKKVGERLVISVDSDKIIWVGGRKQSLDQLEQLLVRERAHRGAPDLTKTTEAPILIQADHNVPWESVQDVVEIAGKLKFRVISFSAKIVAP